MSVIAIFRERQPSKMLINRTRLLDERSITKSLSQQLKATDKEMLKCQIINISETHVGTIGLKFDDFNNNASSYGCFWISGSILIRFFERGDLIYESENKKEIFMKDFKVVKISFCDGTNTKSIYPYALIDDVQLGVGDMVVVKPANHPVNLARVVNVETQPSEEDIRYASQGREIIGKVDTSAYDERKKNEKRKAELKREMDKLVNENKELVLYAALAENSPQMAELLNEYKKLM